MTHVQPSAVRAATAICAVLALGSTPAWAQDAPQAPPAIELPPASAPASQPTIVLPSVQPAPASQPIVQPLPAAPAVAEAIAQEPAAEAPAREKPRQRPAARAPIAPAVDPVAEPEAPVTPEALAPLAAAPAMPASLVPPVADPGLPATENGEAGLSDGEAGMGAAALAVLLLGGIGGGAWLVARSRRRRAPLGEATYEAQPVLVEEPAAPAALFVSNEAAPAPSAHATALARAEGPLPRNRAERDTLLNRMASAPPSGDNPFTSRKARLRRARLILQRREYEERERAAQALEAQSFDWRTYEPSARPSAPATPERVTA